MANLWNPLYLPYGSLTNWYDSTDTTTLTLSTNDTVANWRDKSYKANNLSETDFAQLPIYGTTAISGLSTVDFDESRSINLDDDIVPFNSNAYMIYVGFNNVFTLASTMFNFSGPSAYDNLILRMTTSTTTQLHLKDGPGVGGIIANIPLIEDLSDKTVVYTVDIQDRDIFLSANYSNNVNTTSTRTIPAFNKLTLGAGAPENTGLNGQIGEFIIVQQDAITLADKQKLEGYTAWKWGMQDNLPGGETPHPYRNAPPTVTDVEFRNKLYETSTEEGSSRFRRLLTLA